MDEHRMVFSPVFRQFVKHQPWMWVSIALAILTIVNLVIPGYPSIFAAYMVVFILVMGVMLTFQIYRSKTYTELIEDFRKGFETYLRIVGSEAENSPIRLMNRLPSQRIGEGDTIGAQVWNVMLEKTSVIHNILMWEFQNYIDNFLDRLNPSFMDKELMTTFIEHSWKTIKWYHEDVVRVALKMREERAPRDKSLREDFSRFRMFYNDSLKEIQAARAKGNEEFGLGMKTDLRDLRLPEPE